MALLMVRCYKPDPPMSIAPPRYALPRSVPGSEQTQLETYYHRVIQSRSSVDLSILVKQVGL